MSSPPHSQRDPLSANLGDPISEQYNEPDRGQDSVSPSSADLPQSLGKMSEMDNKIGGVHHLAHRQQYSAPKQFINHPYNHRKLLNVNNARQRA